MVTLLRPIAHCYGVINAINLAKKVAENNTNKKIYVFGLLVHNEEVTKSLLELNIITIDISNINPIERLKEFTKDDIVIFTAHGHPQIYEDILTKNGVLFYDATCPKVKECFNLIKNSLETIYIGKKNHPEANAALTMNKGVHFYDINEKFNDYWKIITPNPLVINQTTLSFLELEDIHEEIRKNIPRANIVDEICDATLLRQKAIASLKDDIDTIIIVGSRKSSNTMKLYEVAKKEHPNKQVYLVNDLIEVKKLDVSFKNLVIASGTSTPLETILEIQEYLGGK